MFFRRAANPDDQAKLYILEKAMQNFGDDAVSRLCSVKDGLDLYVYLDPELPKMQAMAFLSKIFPADLFDDTLEPVMIRYEKVRHYGEDNEKMHKVHFSGALTDILEGVQKNDKAFFDAAQKSKRAKAILQREKKSEITGFGGR